MVTSAYELFLYKHTQSSPIPVPTAIAVPFAKLLEHESTEDVIRPWLRLHLHLFLLFSYLNGLSACVCLMGLKELGDWWF